MSQERMHPDDLRAVMAAQLALSLDDLTTGDVTRGIQGADAILAELARTAKPETEEPHPDCKGCGMGCETTNPETCEMLHCTAQTEASKEEMPRPFQIGDRVAGKTGTCGPVMEGIVKKIDEYCDVHFDADEGGPLRWARPENLTLLKTATPADKLLEEANAALKDANERAKELDNRLVIAESWRNDAALGLGEKRNKRIAELEQWQWDNMKKWLGIIGWGSMTPTQPECPTLIDAALQQGVEDAKRVDTLEARVKVMEEAILFHESSLVAGHEVDRQLWAKVK